ncbi:hypothetical protein K437DRAFT_271677 [Tilletiaria anomala UBC 951]|uniref:UBA domain-containing protein n=1 Tax=Tilletiaria anomala (strain ATCC 24038 / CBS 436.72 / UBC 951) TaxID=1037660 RepID=A0A066WI18_TILAU|nr:uncharacterized protein K437DRAFT_271677 [Tilletiaria anomala UBC 951]KDN53456.1 hypothetical protein K437DRAFT_271677 [Tilletiaria anomala UBC 951]
MPQVKIINDTLLPLHICLKQVSPLYYANNIEPSGGEAVFNPGAVWFTIEARIAQIKKESEKAENEYTRWDTYVPIAAVSVAVLSLGVGAVYVAGTAAATGSISGMLTAISTDMAVSLPTVRRLYKYAKQGQRVVHIGQVIGIGNESSLTNKLAGVTTATPGTSSSGNKWRWLGKKQGSPEDAKALNKAEGKGQGQQLQRKAEKEVENSVARALKNLLDGSVLSSYGWFMSKERTLHIIGGPRATEVEGFLVIETDTYEPFRIVDEKGEIVGIGVEEVPDATEGEKAAALDAVAAVKGGQAHPESEGMPESFKGGNGKNMPPWKERLVASLNSATTQTCATLAEWKMYATKQAETAQEYVKARSGIPAADKAEMQARGWEIGLVEHTEAEGANDVTKYSAVPTPSEALAVPDSSVVGGATTADAEADVPPSPQNESSPVDKLVEMGYTRQEARQALLHEQGNLENALERLLIRDQEKAVLAQSQSGVNSACSSTVAFTADSAVGQTSSSADATVMLAGTSAQRSASQLLTPPEATTTTLSSSSFPAPTPSPSSPGRVLPVKNAESVTQPHWVTRVHNTASGWIDSAERTPFVGGATRIGADVVRKRGDRWLSKDSSTSIAKRSAAEKKGKEKNK